MTAATPGYAHRVKVTSPGDVARDPAPTVQPEPEDKRLTRNLHELLQELRVTQTGVQILTGFLLTLPFSNRFSYLSGAQRHVYLAVLTGSVISTGPAGRYPGRSGRGPAPRGRVGSGVRSRRLGLPRRLATGPGPAGTAVAP